MTLLIQPKVERKFLGEGVICPPENSKVFFADAITSATEKLLIR
jgi:hypothetical protein